MTTETPLLTFEIELPIRWGDMDAMRHVNNTVYFRYMEQTRISWFDVMGFPPDPEGEGPIIISTHCTFLKQLQYPGTVLSRHYVTRIGNSTVDTVIRMSRTDDPDTVYSEGGARIVWVDFPRQKSKTLPAFARERILTPWHVRQGH